MIASRAAPSLLVRRARALFLPAATPARNFSAAAPDKKKKKKGAQAPAVGDASAPPPPLACLPPMSAGAAARKEHKARRRAHQDSMLAKSAAMAEKYGAETVPTTRAERDRLRMSARTKAGRGTWSENFGKWMQRELTAPLAVAERAAADSGPYPESSDVLVSDGWIVTAACMTERLPVITPDREEWELDYMELRDYLWQFGRKMDDSVFTTGNDAPRPWESYVASGHAEEEDAGRYRGVPRGFLETIRELPFEPGFRVTDADLENDERSLDRALAKRLYFATAPSPSEDEAVAPGSSWPFPSEPVLPAGSGDTLLAAALRAFERAVGPKVNVYAPSHAPVAVDFVVHSDEEREAKGAYGTKVYYYRIQYDEGEVAAKEDHAWLTKEEVVERAGGKGDDGTRAGTFLHYLL